MILKSIRLRNFRCFEDTGVIELKPITILVGANSSGKSSFLKFFPLLKNSCKSYTMAWDNNDVDFKSFINTVRNRVPESCIEVEYQFEEKSRTENINLSVYQTIKADETAILHIVYCNGGNKIVVTTNHANLAHWNIDSEAFNFSNVDEVYQNSDFEISTEDSEKYLPNLLIEGSTLSEWAEDKTDSIRTRAKTIKEVLKKTDDCFKSLSNNIQYIQPLRLDTKRSYKLNNTDKDSIRLESDGSNIAHILNGLNDEKFLNLRKWLINKFKMDLKLLIYDNQCQICIREFTEKDSEEKLYDGAHTKELSKEEEEEGKFKNLVDLGFGISQILPLLFIVWQYETENFPNRELIIVIEQPEVHLHPKLQAQYTRLVCNFVKSNPNVRFIIETHSKMFINTLGREIDYNEFDPTFIDFRLFNKSGNETNIQKTEFDNRGYLKEWPINFLDDDAY